MEVIYYVNNFYNNSNYNRTCGERKRQLRRSEVEKQRRNGKRLGLLEKEVKIQKQNGIQL